MSRRSLSELASDHKHTAVPYVSLATVLTRPRRTRRRRRRVRLFRGKGEGQQLSCCVVDRSRPLKRRGDKRGTSVEAPMTMQSSVQGRSSRLCNLIP